MIFVVEIHFEGGKMNKFRSRQLLKKNSFRGLEIWVKIHYFLSSANSIFKWHFLKEELWQKNLVNLSPSIQALHQLGFVTLQIGHFNDKVSIKLISLHHKMFHILQVAPFWHAQTFLQLIKRASFFNLRFCNSRFVMPRQESFWLVED